VCAGDEARRERSSFTATSSVPGTKKDTPRKGVSATMSARLKWAPRSMASVRWVSGPLSSAAPSVSCPGRHWARSTQNPDGDITRASSASQRPRSSLVRLEKRDRHSTTSTEPSSRGSGGALGAMGRTRRARRPLETGPPSASGGHTSATGPSRHQRLEE
jgi:hypothetical protein